MKFHYSCVLLIFFLKLSTAGHAAWAPLAPESDEFDWIQLKSGEWLKGEIRTMYQDDMDFKSDVLGELSLDFDDIIVIRSGRPQMVNISTGKKQAESYRKFIPGGGEEVVTGYLRLEGNEVKVIPEEGGSERTFSRSDVISLTAGEPKEFNYWDAKITLGTNIRKGNVDQGDLLTRTTVRRRTPRSQYYFQYVGNFSQTEDIQTANNHRLTSYHDFFISKDFFWRTANLDFLKDPFRNINNRTTLGTSFGYHIFKKGRLIWDVSGGPGYQYIEYDTVEPGEDEIRRHLTGILLTNYKYELTSRLDIVGNYSFLYAAEDAGGYNFHSDTTLETELLSWMDLDISFIWDFQSDPVSEGTDSEPHKNDYQLITSLGIEF
ncbi:MAG: DUF481 domain-containing protein [Verrucomicrobia bacterium]|nr:DUF481 domain-containing protein [Verrucomicrobiota bacterium]